MTSFLTSDAWFPITDMRPVPINTGTTNVPQLAYMSGAVALGGGNTGFCAFELDPADAPVSGQGKLKIRAMAIVNAVAPAANLTAGLYPVTAFGGASGIAPTVTALGSGLGTTVFTTPGASAVVEQEGAAFAVPAKGQFALAVAASQTVATGCICTVLVQLLRQFA